METPLHHETIPSLPPRLERQGGDESLTDAELAVIMQSRIIGQAILAGSYVNDRMPRVQVERYEQLAKQAHLSPEDEIERQFLKEALVAERDRLSMEWMYDALAKGEIKDRFSQTLGDLTDIALGRARGAQTSEAKKEALRFTRNLIELAKGGQPVELVTGYALALDAEQQLLAARLQAELNARVTRSAAAPSAAPFVH